MVPWKPPLEDIPMSLGDHLHELRKRLMLPILAIGILFVVAFAFEQYLKEVVREPLNMAYQLNPELSEKAGLKYPVKLQAIGIFESIMASMSVSFYTALYLAFPVLAYQLWMFVSVGLTPKERRLAFLFIPAGIIFFYAGSVIGYYFGLPYYYAWMIKWAANDPISFAGFTLDNYLSNFRLMTLIFGFIADIPWLVMVIVRVGFVSVEQLTKHRKVAIMVNVIIAALIAPPDGWSMIIMMIPLLALFEVGLIFARIMMWHHNRLDAKEAQQEAEKAAQAEREERELAASRANTTIETVAPNEDGPIARDQSTSASNGTESATDDSSERRSSDHESTNEDSASNTSEPSDTEDSELKADRYRDEDHGAPEQAEPPPKPLPRGNDEAGMFGDEWQDHHRD